MSWTLRCGVIAAMVTGAVQADPGDLPLLPHTQAIALQHTVVQAPGQPAVDQAWVTAIDRGMTGYVLPSDWLSLTNPDGTPNINPWIDYINSLDALGLSTYMMIGTISTNALQLPTQFIDPTNPRLLAPGISFDSPILINTFGAMLDALVPHLVANGCFYISVGNEVDVWLADNPDQIQPFATFVDAARQRVHQNYPDLAVGATLTSEALGNQAIIDAIVGVSDVVSYTYYPLGPNSFTVRPPSVVESDIDLMVAAAGQKQVIFQEIGYPSGWPVSGIGSTVELQREFVGRVFAAMSSRRPQIRFWSMLHIGDWDQATLDTFQNFYGFFDPKFEEYLGTIGLMWTDGTPKPALDEFLRQLGGCPYDADGNGLVNIDDLFELIRSPADTDGDGDADADDVRCLEKYLRRFERRK